VKQLGIRVLIELLHSLSKYKLRDKISLSQAWNFTSQKVLKALKIRFSSMIYLVKVNSLSLLLSVLNIWRVDELIIVVHYFVTDLYSFKIYLSVISPLADS
jgi:hypothetical protein